MKVNLEAELAKVPVCAMLKGERRPAALEIVVGCQPLAQVVNGVTKFGAFAGENVLSKTVDLIEGLINEGREVPEVPVEWRPKHLN